MKAVLRVFVSFIILVMFFLLGFFFANNEEISTKNSWEKIEKSFVNLDKNGITKNTSVNNKEMIENEFEEIINYFQIKKIIKINNKKVIASSYAKLTQNNNINTKYSILRINFTYLDKNDIEKKEFLYFYFYKTENQWLSSSWSLFEILTEGKVTLK